MLVWADRLVLQPPAIPDMPPVATISERLAVGSAAGPDPILQWEFPTANDLLGVGVDFRRSGYGETPKCPGAQFPYASTGIYAIRATWRACARQTHATQWQGMHRSFAGSALGPGIGSAGQWCRVWLRGGLFRARPLLTRTGERSASPHRVWAAVRATPGDSMLTSMCLQICYSGVNFRPARPKVCARCTRDEPGLESSIHLCFRGSCAQTRVRKAVTSAHFSLSEPGERNTQ